MPNPGPADPPELADVGRLARRLLNRAVRTARTEDQPLQRLLLDHLGPEAATLPTVSATWASYEHVNVQLGLEAWLETGRGRTHEVFGITVSVTCGIWTSGSAISSSPRTVRSARPASAA